MTNGEPIVSIIIPMLNADKYIIETINSILTQRESSFEIIVIDDRSTDRSALRVRGFRDERIRLVPGPGRGVAAAMNTGLAAAGGAIILYCDADDLYPPMRVDQQLRWFDGHPEFDAVCGTFSTIDPEGHLIAEMRCGDAPAEITAELRNGKVRTHLCTYAIRSSLVRKVQGFREFFESAQDIDFQLRISEVGRIAYVPQNWYLYRIHASSITHTQPNALRKFFEQTAYDLQKQRRESGLDDLQRGRLPPKPANDRSRPMSAQRQIQGHLLGRAWEEHRTGNKARALRTAVRALAADPFQVRVWRSTMALLLKPSRTASR